MMKNKINIFITFFLIVWCIVNIGDLTSSLFDDYDFLFAQTIVFGILILPSLIILTFLSLPLKKSQIKWHRVLGTIGIGVVIVDILVNIVAFIWNLIG